MTDPIRRAHAARSDLRETEQAFSDLRAALIDKLLSSPAEAATTRETCYFAVQALDGVKTALLHVVAGGEIEEAVAELTRPK